MSRTEIEAIERSLAQTSPNWRYVYTEDREHVIETTELESCGSGQEATVMFADQGNGHITTPFDLRSEQDAKNLKWAVDAHEKHIPYLLSRLAEVQAAVRELNDASEAIETSGNSVSDEEGFAQYKRLIAAKDRLRALAKETERE